MKKNTKNIISLLLVIILVVLGIKSLNHILRPVDTDSAYQQIESFHSLEDNSLEVIVYGSSHAWRGLDTRILYNEYGIGAYNYAFNWQKLNTVEAFINDSLTCQKPKLALIETYYINDVLNGSELNAEIFYSRYLHSKNAKQNYLKECFGNDVRKYLSYYMPLYAFHDNWVDVSMKSIKPLRSNGEFLSTLGFIDLSNVDEVTIFDPSTIEQKELSKEAIDELDKIIRICKENNIEVLFFTNPMEEEFPYGQAIEEYAKNNGCSYVNIFDYIDEVGIDGSIDFSDYGHLNTNGAIKVANFLGKYIKDNYQLTDFREVENNIFEKYIK